MERPRVAFSLNQIVSTPRSAMPLPHLIYDSDIVQAHSAANYILNVNMISISSQQASQVAAIPDSKHSDSIEFQHVSFNYASYSEVPVLQNPSFAVKHGENLAILEGRGSGKSTVVALLERSHKATQGEILVREKPLASTDMNPYHSLVSLVSRETCLHQGSLHENTLLGVADGRQLAKKIISTRVKMQICTNLSHHCRSETPRLEIEGFLSVMDNDNVWLSHEL